MKGEFKRPIKGIYYNLYLIEQNKNFVSYNSAILAVLGLLRLPVCF